MLPFTDDQGRTHGDVADIKAEILPKECVTEDQLNTLLKELHEIELVVWEPGVFTEYYKWKKFQILRGRPANTLFPDFQEDTGKGEKSLESSERSEMSEKDGEDGKGSDPLSSLLFSSKKGGMGENNTQLSESDIVEMICKYMSDPGIDNHLSSPNAKVESRKFYDYYQSNGWMVGKNKMQDWRASVRGWLSKVKPNELISSGQGNPKPQQNMYACETCNVGFSAVDGICPDCGNEGLG
ncbi:hypothetical protein HN803_08585 [candidate division WWE3 bacterium]|nr:hypothetical protein [candidate division WWE3 bacterium]